MAARAIILRIQDLLGGEPILGRRITGQRDLIEMVRAGLPHSSLDSLIHSLALPADTLTAALALPRRTLARRKKQAKLNMQESDRLLRLARVAARAIEILGSPHNASAWLQKPNRALGGLAPLAEMDTDTGARMVEEVLGRIEHGVFS